jgi:hypothetical protein
MTKRLQQESRSGRRRHLGEDGEYKKVKKVSCKAERGKERERRNKR